MGTKLRLCLCLGMLAVALLEGPRAGALLGELTRGPYGTFHRVPPPAQAARHGEVEPLQLRLGEGDGPELPGAEPFERG